MIAAASILGGKLVMAVFVLDSGIQSEAEKEPAKCYDSDMHQAMSADAADFAALSGPEEHEAFMLGHGYADGESVAPEHLAAFRRGSAPLLQRWGANMPPIEVAREEYVAHLAPIWAADLRQELSHADVLKDSFGLMDLLFFGLGVFTAFSLVARQTEEAGTLAPVDAPAGSPMPGQYPGNAQVGPPGPQQGPRQPGN